MKFVTQTWQLYWHPTQRLEEVLSTYPVWQSQVDAVELKILLSPALQLKQVLAAAQVWQTELQARQTLLEL